MTEKGTDLTVEFQEYPKGVITREERLAATESSQRVTVEIEGEPMPDLHQEMEEGVLYEGSFDVYIQRTETGLKVTHACNTRTGMPLKLRKVTQEEVATLLRGVLLFKDPKKPLSEIFPNMEDVMSLGEDGEVE